MYRQNRNEIVVPTQYEYYTAFSVHLQYIMPMNKSNNVAFMSQVLLELSDIKHTTFEETL